MANQSLQETVGMGRENLGLIFWIESLFGPFRFKIIKYSRKDQQTLWIASYDPGSCPFCSQWYWWNDNAWYSDIVKIAFEYLTNFWFFCLYTAGFLSLGYLSSRGYPKSSRGYTNYSIGVFSVDLICSNKVSDVNTLVDS